MSARVTIDRDRIAGFCRLHRISKLSLFGSVLRDDFRPDSDVDVLIEFEPGHVIGLIRLAGVERELSELIGRKVFIITFARCYPGQQRRGAIGLSPPTPMRMAYSTTGRPRGERTWRCGRDRN